MFLQKYIFYFPLALQAGNLLTQNNRALQYFTSLLALNKKTPYICATFEKSENFKL